MSIHAELFRIFLASPSGLEREIDWAEETIWEFNREFAIQHHVLFLPVSWKYLPAALIRPQDEINKDLKRSDYFLLTLFNRWGSPTVNKEGKHYDSAIQEEYELAKELCACEECPMTDVAVFFKSIPIDSLADAGPQLASVLKFKEHLDHSKEAFYQEYDSEQSYRNRIGRQLAGWLLNWQSCQERDEEKTATPKLYSIATGTIFPVVRPRSTIPLEQCMPNDLRCKVDALLSEGKITAAERMLASATETREIAMLFEFGRFQSIVGKIDYALIIMQELLELAERNNDERYEAEAHLVLGFINRTKGNTRAALEEFRYAFEILKNIDDVHGQARCLIHLGITYRIRGDLDGAENMLEEARNISEKNGYTGTLALCLDSLGVVARIRGDLQEAEGLYKAALAYFQELGMSKREMDCTAHLATVERIRGNINEARSLYEQALEFNKRNGRKRMVAENLGGLGNVFLSSKKYTESEKLFYEALEIYREIGCGEGMAKQYANLGMLYLKRESREKGDLSRSEQMFSESKKINSEIGGKEGIAVNCWQYGMMAMKVRNYELAKNMLHESARLHEELGNRCGEADSLGRLGDCYCILGNTTEAEKCYLTSLNIFELMGAHPHIEEIKQALKNLQGD